jgi:methionyl-tRNA formyltransferase
MKLHDFAVIAADTPRTKVYLQVLEQHNIKPGHVIIMKNQDEALLPGQFESGGGESSNYQFGEYKLTIDISESIEETILKQEDISFNYVSSTDINSQILINEITKRNEAVFLFSGYGGSILREGVLNVGKRFLHVHGGYLPDYKGSTTNYYSLLQENSCGASSIFLEKEIDCGPILIRKKFDPPKNRIQIDYIYDSLFRAIVLVQTLQQYIKKGTWFSDVNMNKGGDTYFIIHPVLKHIAIISDS